MRESVEQRNGNTDLLGRSSLSSPNSPRVQRRIDKFKSDLRIMDCELVVQKHILGGQSYILDEDTYFELRQAVASNFDLNPHEIFIVGSAKLGFSIAQDKRYRPFHNRSDIDLAIVSAPLFDDVWRRVFEYWESPARDIYWDHEGKFKEYLFRGWIRPDKLPPVRDFPYRRNWFEFFRQLAAGGKFGEYKVAAGLYRSLYFLEKYQSICTKQCQDALIDEIGDM